MRRWIESYRAHALAYPEQTKDWKKIGTGEGGYAVCALQFALWWTKETPMPKHSDDDPWSKGVKDPRDLTWQDRQHMGRYQCRHCNRTDLTFREKEKALGVLVFAGFDRAEAEEQDPICKKCAAAIGRKYRFLNLAK